MTETPTEAARAVDAELDRLVRENVVPGGVAVVATPDEVIYERAFGHRALEPHREAATPDTVYDLASLTKPLVTALMCLRARERGELDFEEPISRLVPEMLEGGRSAPRVPSMGELLLHAGGLPSWKPLYALVEGGLPERAAWLSRHRDAPGIESVYGCPGYQVLGLALERWSATSFQDAAVEELFAEELELDFVPDDRVERTAPTENGNVFERELAGDEARGYEGWRSGMIRAEVHDHNAFTLGGAAGNAGLFGTARAVATHAARLLVPEMLLMGETLEQLSREPMPSLAGERRTWGFQLASSAGSPAGPTLSRRAFGHAGFTGTSVFVDPDRRAVYVLLTNRVHPRYVAHGFHADRRAFHVAASFLAEKARV
jgi:CubicO group peptidase (beta-lactamase class C family)